MKNYVKILKREMLKIKEDFIEGYNESEANTKTTPTIKTSVSFKEVDDSKGTYIFCTNIESDVLNNITTIGKYNILGKIITKYLKLRKKLIEL